MKTDLSTRDKLAEERKVLANGARLHAYHWAILILSAALTIGAWSFSKSQVEQKARIQFERESTQVVELVSERLRKYEDALWGGVAAMHARGSSMDHGEWRRFAESLHIETKYQGINGIGVINKIERSKLDEHLAAQRQARPNYRIYPTHSEKDLYPIVYIEPEEPNAKAVGLDMAHETNRYLAARKARDTGLAQITGPIVLVQDEGQTPGFLFYAPYYSGRTASTVDQRQENFLGLVYAPFVVNRLMAGTLEKEKRRVGLRLTDGDSILYDEHTSTEEDFDAKPMYTIQTPVDAYGRTWTFDIRTTLSFRNATQNNQPVLILFAGAGIDLLLLTLFLSMTRANRKTLNFADRMTAELKRNAVELQVSNADLESFAYIASHDLKTPLRGIEDLTTYLEEDLEDYLSSPDANTDVPHNLQRLHQQIDRMDNLIRGILDYSGVGARTETLELCNVREVLTSVGNELGIREEQLELVGEFPMLSTYLVRFGQVVSNLIGNAFKYHHDPENALVRVECKEGSRFYEFTVADNGPGIEEKFHSRIFEVFQTLQSRDEIESTGVGLSIVKRSVESLGGSITVTSEVGKGTVFKFEWPKDIVEDAVGERMVI